MSPVPTAVARPGTHENIGRTVSRRLFQGIANSAGPAELVPEFTFGGGWQRGLAGMGFSPSSWMGLLPVYAAGGGRAGDGRRTR